MDKVLLDVWLESVPHLVRQPEEEEMTKNKYIHVD
jgi:hypothetical protein